jgi:hypothetical protein
VHTARALVISKCAKKDFHLKFFSRTESGVEKINRVLEKVFKIVCERHLLPTHTFAVAALRLLRYEKLQF